MVFTPPRQDTSREVVDKLYRAGFSDRDLWLLREFYSPKEFNYLFGEVLSEDKLRVQKQSRFFDKEDYRRLAYMEVMDDEDFRVNSLRVVRPKYLKDYLSLTIAWTIQEKDLKALNIGAGDEEDLRVSRELVTEMLDDIRGPSASCRVFYYLKYPERFEEELGPGEGI